ncbi:MAG: tetratricopeptide repeat protein [Planctomycetota bacterium]|nr:tetratricopeptide repeat protein [Planctomycetota bacterium]
MSLRKSGLALLFLALCCAVSAAAERVTVHLKNGTRLTGELVEFSDGRKYVIAYDGQRKEIEESDVRSLEVLSAALPEAGIDAGQDAAQAGIGPLDSEEPQFAAMAPSAVEKANESFTKADEAEKAHEYDRAIELFAEASKCDPWFAIARFRLARVLAKAGRFSECEREIDGILKIDPVSIPALELKHFLYQKTGQKDLQLVAREEMLAARYTGAELIYRKAHLWLRSGNMTKARAAWAEYLSADPSLSGVFNIEARLMREGRGYLEKGDHDTAVARFFDAERMNSILHQEVEGLVIDAREKKIGMLRSQGLIPAMVQEIDTLLQFAPSKRDQYEGVIREELIACCTRTVEQLDAKLLDETLSLCGSRFGAEKAGELWIDTCGQFLAAFRAAEKGTRTRFAAPLAVLRKYRPAGQGGHDELLATCFRELGDEFSSEQYFPEAREAYENALLLDTRIREELVAAIVATYATQGKLLVDSGQFGEAVELLKVASEIRPENTEIADALDDAQLKYVMKIAAGNRPLSERVGALEAYLLKPCAEHRRAAGERQLGELKFQLKQLKVRVIRDMNKYSPLAVGSEFKYMRGNKTTEIRRILSVEEKPDCIQAVIEVESILAALSSKSVHTMTQTESELSVTRDGKHDTLLKFPVGVGSSWEWQEGRVTVKRRYLADNAAVATRAGEFKNCLKVEMRTSMAVEVEGSAPVEVVSYHYFAPGVGMVKIEFPDAVLNDLGIELVSYSIK